MYFSMNYLQKHLDRIAVLNREFNYHQSGYLRELINKYKTLIFFGNFEYEKNYYKSLIEKNSFLNKNVGFFKYWVLNSISFFIYTINALVIILGGYIIKDNLEEDIYLQMKNEDNILRFRSGQVLSILILVFYLKFYFEEIYVAVKEISETCKGVENYYALEDAEKEKEEALEANNINNYNYLNISDGKYNKPAENRSSQKNLFCENLKIETIDMIDVCFDYKNSLTEQQNNDNKNLKQKEKEKSPGINSAWSSNSNQKSNSPGSNPTNTGELEVESGKQSKNNAAKESNNQNTNDSKPPENKKNNNDNNDNDFKKYGFNIDMNKLKIILSPSKTRRQPDGIINSQLEKFKLDEKDINDSLNIKKFSKKNEIGSPLRKRKIPKKLDTNGEEAQNTLIKLVNEENENKNLKSNNIDSKENGLASNFPGSPIKKRKQTSKFISPIDSPKKRRLNEKKIPSAFSLKKSQHPVYPVCDTPITLSGTVEVVTQQNFNPYKNVAVDSKPQDSEQFFLSSNYGNNDNSNNNNKNNLEDELDFIVNLDDKFNNKKLEIKNVNLSFESSKINFLIGKSGSGKSTILSLILNLFKPTSGKITLNKQFDINKINQRDYFDLIGYVPQESIFYDLSVKENILFFQDNIPEERIFEVVKFLKMNQFIDRLKHGIDTKIGPNGSGLSGGQRQLISIARALVKNPKILLLDEFTSALDNILTKEVFGILDSIAENMIVIVVTHHLKLVDFNNKRNKIIFLDQGKAKVKDLEKLRKKFDKHIKNNINQSFSFGFESDSDEDSKFDSYSYKASEASVQNSSLSRSLDKDEFDLDGKKSNTSCDKSEELKQPEKSFDEEHKTNKNSANESKRQTKTKLHILNFFEENQKEIEKIHYNNKNYILKADKIAEAEKNEAEAKSQGDIVQAKASHRITDYNNQNQAFGKDAFFLLLINF